MAWLDDLPASRRPFDRIVRATQRIARDGAHGQDISTNIEAVIAGIDVCRRCDLWRDATQAVPGEGPEPAAKARAYAAFVEDLSLAWTLAN